MTFTFRPAVRSNVGLIVGLAGGTGSGKTYTAMRLATGIAGDKPFAFIDTEAGRGKHYADKFRFDHGDLKPPFRPSAYTEAIEAADKAGYPVIVVDSVSHEWAGDGGVLEWQEEEYARLGGNEKIKLLSWSAPKQGHKRMVSRLLQSRAHLILCFRAEPHVEMIKEDGKTKVVPKTGLTGYKGWFPVTEKNLPFELTVSFMLMADQPGIPLPIKLQEQHKPLFPLDRPITEDAGRLIAEWAAGGKETVATQVPGATSASTGAGGTPASAAVLTDKQVADLETMCIDAGLSIAALKKAAEVDDFKQLDFDRSKAWIEKKKAAATALARPDLQREDER